MTGTDHAETTRAARPPGPDDRPARRRRTPQERAADAQRIVDLYQNGKRSIQQIADETGLSHGTVYNTLAEAKVKMRGRGGNHPRRRHRTTGGSR
jgi:DNA invertase Pin-like site-specific DNA recombinase